MNAKKKNFFETAEIEYLVWKYPHSTTQTLIELTILWWQEKPYHASKANFNHKKETRKYKSKQRRQKKVTKHHLTSVNTLVISAASTSHLCRYGHYSQTIFTHKCSTNAYCGGERSTMLALIWLYNVFSAAKKSVGGGGRQFSAFVYLFICRPRRYRTTPWQRKPNCFILTEE